MNTLIYSMGDEADDILRSLRLSEEDRKKYNAVKEKFDAHFVQRRNVIFERAKFNMRRQEEGESVDNFITSLYELAEHCGYGDLHNEMIRDRIVVGICNSALSEKLQLDSKLTLESAVTQVRQSEAVKLQQPLLRASWAEKPDLPVGSVQRGGGNRGKPSKGQGSQNSEATTHRRPGPSKGCSRCGKHPAHDKAHCPAKDAICRKCNKKGHFQALCRSAKVGGVQTGNTASINSGGDTDDAFLGAVQSKCPSEDDDPWAVQLTLQGRPVTLNIDTGAEVTVISDQIWKAVGQPTLTPPQRYLRGPDSTPIPTRGKFVGTLKLGTRAATEEIYVVSELTKSLLGTPAIKQLQLIQRLASLDTTSDPRKQYPSLFEGLGKLEGAYSIQLRSDAKPFALSTPRRVAIPLLEPVKKELQRMESMGVISKVQQPTEWCAGMVVVPKANGKVRICVDLTKLNESVQRERHPLPAVDQTLAQLAGAKVFSKLDANSGFWQIPLDPASSLLTTFITPFGRYCFHRLPFGISSAPEHFQRRMSEALSGLAGVVCMMDDVLIHGTTRVQHDERLNMVLQRLQTLGLTLNSEKCQFAQTSVKFLGHVIDGSGIRPDPSKVSAILEVPAPKNTGDVRRFLGMVNQLSKFAPHLAETTQPIRELLTKEKAWVWEDAQKRAFSQIKEALVASPVLSLFDPSLETIVSADASSFGLGAVLKQRQRTGELKPVAYVSRAMSPTERRYAQIEKEALAFTWACERLSDYLTGLKFHIETDHKPLVPLFSSKHLEELPPRVQRFRLRMMRFAFTIAHVPGKELVIADTLSRAPAADPTPEDEILQDEAQAFACLVLSNLPATDQRLEQIKQHQMSDEVCKAISQFCQSRWPDRRDLLPALKPYFPMANEFTVEDGLLLRGCRIVIPPPLRKELLHRVHEGHQGITKCRERARASIWWPGISRDLAELVSTCEECTKAQTQRAQPLTPSPLPDLPWQRAATDLFQWKGAIYVLVVDYYSRYIEIALLGQPTAEEVITRIKSIFARHGIPEVVVSDNGPQYTSQAFEDFAKDYQFYHQTSSPYYPQSNGEAERAVKTIKELLKKGGDPYKALLAYRTTPTQTGYSPSELLMGRLLRSTIPITKSQRQPRVIDPQLVKRKDEENKARQKNNFDSRRGARELPSLQTGDLVWLPDREVEGEVQQEVAPQSYLVESADGTYRRNRRHITQLPDRPQVDSEQTNSEQTASSTGPLTSPSPPRRSSRLTRPPERLDPSWVNSGQNSI